MTQQDETRLGEINALLGRGTEYEGKLCFEGRVRIDGKFRGEIHSDDLLILGDGSDVDATVHVGKLIVRGGVLRGRVFATQVVELFAPARVHADIETPLFFVDRGVVFDGRCTMGGATSAALPMDESVADRPSDAGPVGSTAAAIASDDADARDSIDGAGESPSSETEAGDASQSDSEAKPKRRRTRKSRA